MAKITRRYKKRKKIGHIVPGDYVDNPNVDIGILFDGTNITNICCEVDLSEGWCEIFVRGVDGEILRTMIDSKPIGNPLRVRIYGDIEAYEIHYEIRTENDS